MSNSNSRLNVALTVLTFLVILFTSLISRKFLLSSVGDELFSVNVILTNYINFLAVFELGLGITALFMFYNPVSKKMDGEVLKIYLFFKRIYKKVIILTLFFSVVGFYFIWKMLSDIIEFEVLVATCSLLIFSQVIVLLFSTEKYLLYASHRIYLFSALELFCKLFLFSLQILVLKSSFLDSSEKLVSYTFLFFFFTIVQYYLVNRFAKEKFNLCSRSLNDTCLDKNKKSVIFTKVKGSINHKIGDAVMNYTDYFVISIFLSAASVVNVSNYVFITTSAVMLVTKVFEGLSSKVGHLLITGEDAHKYAAFKKLHIISLYLSTTASCVFYYGSSEFVSNWFGEQYALDNEVVLLMTLTMFFQILRVSSNMMKLAGGIVDKDKYIPIIESVIYLSLSILLTGQYGIVGIFYAKIITSLVLSNWIKQFFIYRYIVNREFKDYLFAYLISVFVFLVSFSAVGTVESYLPRHFHGWFGLLNICILSSIVSLIFTFLFRNGLFWKKV